MRPASLLAAVLALSVPATACQTRREPMPRARLGSGSAGAPAPVSTSAPDAGPAAPPAPRAIARDEFNRWAVRLNLPIFWIGDTDGDGAVDPGEVAPLLFYPTAGEWTRDGKPTPAFDAAVRAIAAASVAPPPSGPDARRQILVGQDLDAGRPTLVQSDLTALSADEKAFVRRMMAAAGLVDELYEKMRGLPPLAARLPPDPASRSLFRRNRGPACVSPATERDPACSAIPGAPRPVFDIYPAELQAAGDVCAALEKRPDARALLEDHFAVVRGSGTALRAVPYTEAYKAE